MDCKKTSCPNCGKKLKWGDICSCNICKNCKEYRFDLGDDGLCPHCETCESCNPNLKKDYNPEDYRFVICPDCNFEFGLKLKDELNGKVCECGHEFCVCKVCQQSVGCVDEYGYCTDCIEEDEEKAGGCNNFTRKVTPDIEDLAAEIVECIEDCNLNHGEQVVYVANMIGDLFPNYKRDQH